MKAQVLEAPQRMRFLDIEVPEISAGEILVRVRVCGISEDDRRLYEGTCISPLPVTPGHEVLGTVEAMGADVRGQEIGTRVCVDSGWRRGADIYEKTAGGFSCIRKVEPCTGLNGGFAEYMKVPAEKCWAVPEEIEDYTASQAAPILQDLRLLQNALPPQEKWNYRGTSCVILGSRAGLYLAAIMRFLGFAPIIVIGEGEQNLAASVRIGADIVIDASRVRDPLEAALKELGGEGAQTVIDVEGNGEAHKENLRVTADGGRLYSLTRPAGPTQICPADPDEIGFPEVFKLLQYERINPRSSYTMAVPVENVEWALREWTKDARLLKAFMASSLKEDFYFEHYRSPIDASLYEK